MSKHWTDKLVAMNACPDAVEWARGYPSLAAAWKACRRADWMLWLAGELCRTVPARKRLVLAVCACARTALKYVPEGEKRPLIAIQTAERWARGTHSVTPEDVRATAYAAHASATHAAAAAAHASATHAAAAAYAYATAYAAAAAHASANATHAAAAYAAHASATHAAADAAYAYAAYAADAAYAYATMRALSRMSNIVRKHYPIPPRWGRRE
jgi:hypothetical protein